MLGGKGCRVLGRSALSRHGTVRSAAPRLPSCCSGIPDYRSPADYSSYGPGSSSGGQPINPPTNTSANPTSSSSYASPSSYSMPDYSAPTASVGAGGGYSIGGSGGGEGGSGDGGGGDGGGGPWRPLTVLFAALVAAGGGVAYRSKGSRASIVAATTVAGALLLAAALMSGRTRVPATMLALAASCTLGIYMGKGYARTRRAWPQGAFTALSLALSAGYVTSIL